MQRTSIYRVLTFVVLALLAPAAWAGDALSFFNNWFVTGDYVVGGVGLRAKGVNGWATGTITMPPVPTGAEPVAAFLYWATSEPTTTPAARIGYFNGFKIQGTVLGNPQSPNLPCYSSGGALGLPGTGGPVYRADVLRYLPVNASNVRQVTGKQTVKLPDSGGNGNGNLLYTDGASLVVIYKVVIPGSPTVMPLRAVVIYNGAFSMDKHSSGMTQIVGGFYQASASAGAKITNIVANGQPGFSTPLSINGTNLNSSPFVGAEGTRWDNPTYNFSLAKDAASFSALTTVGANQVCVTWAAMVASMNVQDTDRDGLLDAWETKGLHRNTQVSPATFGGCSNFPTEPCVPLPNMGANPGVKDIFIQMDWMHGSGDGTGGTDGRGAHNHIPKLGALSAVAATFAPRGINLHFDVGNNYQGAQSACGNVACSFIVPTSTAQGGSDIDESTLVCRDTATHVCDYHQPYPVLSFEFGFASVRDGNSRLNISPHFVQNRKDIFHYSLFAHALGGPYNINGQPVDPTTNQPTTVPKSYSGIAHRPGGGFMVTLGLWRSDLPGDDQVGSPLGQAGTIMHELGHNLGLAHAGLSTKPNCMPNYQSVMNYLYQTRGLTDASGPHVDFSFGALPVLKENSLPTGALPNQKYAIRFFGPVGPSTPAGSAAQLHCDGTPITNGAMEVRLEGPSAPVGTPNWSNGKINPPPPDVNFDGVTTGQFADQPDWTSLNLQQIGTGYHFGGLSLGALATDGGAYATDGGALATDAGALATDGGVFATDGGAFATDGGAFATDGGVFATDGGVFATDGGAYATDAGDLDQTTLILSSSAGPPTGLTATNTISSIQLAWAPPDGVTQSYNIYRCAGAGCTPNAAAPAFGNVAGGITTPSFIDTVNDFVHAGASCPAGSTCYNTLYTYAVTSRAMVNTSVVESGFSQPLATSQVTHLFVIADAQSAVYGAPLTPTFKVYRDVLVSLSGVTCTYPGAPRNVGTGYLITCSGPTLNPPAEGITYNQPYLTFTPGTLTIIQRPITVTAAPSTKVYDGKLTSPATPTITVGSLAYSDLATWTETYDDPNVHPTANHVMTPAGSVSDSNGGNNYNVTFAIISTGIISPAPLTVTASSATVTYGDLVPAITPGYSGFVNGENSSVLTIQPNCTTTYAQVSPVSGSPYPTSCSGASGNNYAISYTPGTVTVNRASLQITASTATLTYGANAPTVTPSFSGFVNNESSLALTTQPTCSTAYARGSAVSGSPYSASCSGAVDNNYTISYTPGTVTVNRAALQITASSAIVTYGANAPNIGASFSGFVNSENNLVLTTQPLCGTSYALGSPISGSPYLTSCLGAAANNYNITYLPGIVTVSRATLQITASSPTLALGAAVPIITPGFTGFVNSESYLVLTTQPACSTTYVQASAVGSYPTSCTGAAGNNYAISYVDGTLTVTLAPQITAGPVTGFKQYTYPATLLAAAGGTPPYTWSGASITGMNLTTGGVLTGLPTDEGTGTVTVTDANNLSVSLPFKIVGPTSVQGALPVDVTTISNIDLTGGNGSVQRITTTPGAAVTLRFHYDLVEVDCPGCFDQLSVGFVSIAPAVCYYLGQPGSSGTTGVSGSASANLIAPSIPGRYYIAYHKYQQYSCDPTATAALKPSDSVIAVVDVIPTASVTWQAVTLTNIGITPPQPGPGTLITATFSWNAPVSGTIGFGFNTDPAMIQCGALNPSPASPTFTVPSLPGRYYLSIDNPNTCIPNPAPTPWQSGIPGSDFARYIGVVDVQ